jgi:hypothetical protein
MKLRVLTLNVWNDEGTADRTALINHEIRRLKPDLISFQEVVRKCLPHRWCLSYLWWIQLEIRFAFRLRNTIVNEQFFGVA